MPIFVSSDEGTGPLPGERPPAGPTETMCGIFKVNKMKENDFMMWMVELSLNDGQPADSVRKA